MLTNMKKLHVETCCDLFTCIFVAAIKVKSKKYKMNFPRNYFLEIKKI